MTAERSPEGLERAALVAFAVFAGLFIAVLGLATDRAAGVEDLTCFNPTYMYVVEGRVSFPAYGFFTEECHDTLYLHPSTYYVLVALLMKVGLGLYYAQALPSVVLSWYALAVVVTSRFSRAATVGLTFGLAALVGLRTSFWPDEVTFGCRPDAHVAIAFFAGLVTLESARLEGFRPTRLFLGAAVLTYSSMLHHPSAVAFLGAAVYAVWAVRELGWVQARPALAAITAGGLAVGIPYLALYVLPNLGLLRAWMVEKSAVGSGMGTTLAANFAAYRETFAALDRASPRFGVYGLPLAIIAGAGVPPVVVSAFILARERSTRGIALAQLPAAAFLFFFCRRKLEIYMMPEHLFVLAAAVTATARLLLRGSPAPRRTVALVAALAALIVASTPRLHRARLGLQVSELEIARAAGREILGADAFVGSRHGLWYASGAARWYDATQELHDPARLPDDLAAWLRAYDALGDYSFLADFTRGRSLPQLYARRELELAGFYFARDPATSYALFRSRPGPDVKGFVALGESLCRFDPDPAGDVDLVVAVIGSATVERLVPPTIARATFALPAPERGQVELALATASIESAAAVRDRIRGRLSPVEPRAFVARTLADDRPIAFSRTYAEAIAGVALPSGPARALELAPVSTRSSFSGDPSARTVQAVMGSHLEQQLMVDLLELVPGAPYRISFDLTLERGGFLAEVLDEYGSLARVKRTARRPLESQLFVFRARADRCRLIVSSWFDNAPTRFTLARPRIERVSLPGP